MVCVVNILFSPSHPSGKWHANHTNALASPLVLTIMSKLSGRIFDICLNCDS